MAILNFNASNVDPGGSFEPLPPGWYHVIIVDSEMKGTAAGDGAYLSLQFQVIEGDFAERRIFTNLNLDNPNDVAVRIANENLSAICHCTGVIQLEDSEQLHGIPLQIKVSVRPETEQYAASNDVKGYRSAGGISAKDIAKDGGASSPPAKAPPSAAKGPATKAPPATPGKAAPPAPPAKAPPKAPPKKPEPVTHDPIAAAIADGWEVHPDDDSWYYRDEDMLEVADLVALYSAPEPEAEEEAAPAKKAPPAPPGAAKGAGGKPPWLNKG